MPNDKELNIHLRTTADAAGVEAIKTGVEALSKAQLEAADIIAKREAYNAEAREKQASAEMDLMNKNAEGRAAFQKENFEAERAGRAQAEAAEEARIQTELEGEEKVAKAQSGNTEKQLSDVRRLEAAESTAHAVQAQLVLQKLARLREIANQAVSSADDMEKAFATAYDENATGVEIFEDLSKAGVSAAGTIAEAWANGGPLAAVGATIVIFKDGLLALFQDAEDLALEFDAKNSTRLEEFQKKIDAAMGDGPSLSTDRENTEQRRAREYRGADQEALAASRTARQEGRTDGLDAADIKDPAARQRRQTADALQAQSKAAEAAEQEANRKLAAEQKAQQSLTENLGRQRENLSQQGRTAERTKDQIPFDDEDKTSEKALAVQLKEMEATRAEINRIEGELDKSRDRAAELFDKGKAGQEGGAADAAFITRKGGQDLGKVEESERQKWRKESEGQADEDADRREKATKDFERVNKSRGGQVADRAGDFMRKNKKGNDFDSMDRAFDDLKDGATEQELAKAKQILLEFRGTVLAKDAKNAAALSELWAMVAQLGKDVKGGEQRAKNERD
jgi:hypothetical protein